MGYADILYSCLLSLIRSFKQVELQVLKIFRPFVDWYLRDVYERIGVVFHKVTSAEDDTWRKRWSSEDEARVLAKCKYNSLCHLKMIDQSLFLTWGNRGSLGVGESYVNGDWTYTSSEEDVCVLAERALSNRYYNVYLRLPWNRLFHYLEYSAFNIQSKRRAGEANDALFDIGNDFFKSFLGATMQYSTAYWAKANNLDEAQQDKMDLIARKLDLRPGMSVLDLGCGWGTLAKYLAENYGVVCVGVTLSREGAEYARQACEGLPVEIRVQDYRDINERFDRIVSIQLMEHVGVRNHRTFFEGIHKCLRDDGLALIHTSGVSDDHPRNDPFIHEYLSPNLSLTYQGDVTIAARDLFIIEDWHNLGIDLARTAEVWLENFQQNWPNISDKYGTRFYRSWRVYFLGICAGVRSRNYHSWQIVFSKNGTSKEYTSVR